MKKAPLPDQDYLEEIFIFDFDRGVLIWKERDGAPDVWNRSWAGKISGSKSKDGYINVGVNGKLYRAHRLIWKLIYGYDPNFIDHINGDVSDNRLQNLRDVSHQENHKNRNVYKTNTSGVTGVIFNKRLGKWSARIGVDGKYIHLGVFSDFELAKQARLDAESHYGFHKNHGRDRIGKTE